MMTGFQVLVLRALALILRRVSRWHHDELPTPTEIKLVQDIDYLIARDEGRRHE